MGYFLPVTVAEATAGLTEKNYLIVAGGTDFYPARADKPVRDDVMDISALNELRTITIEENQTRIGALATWTDIVEADLPDKFQGLKLAAREIGALQIQNAGTVVGNLCNASPAADGVPPLLTLNANIEISSAAGRRVLPLQEFVLGNRRTALREGEMVTAILIPDDAAKANGHFLKLGSRQYLVISFVMVATLLEADANGSITQARISVGACSEVACRLADLEVDLIGVSLAEAGNIAAPNHLKDLSPISDIRATAEYRKDAALELVRRSLSACAEGLS
ncbi:MAG: xanthine dehydrogenase family protein subunit M [Alphaproteobacteria bacterium]|jgi:CO/xanthine dehydrogenase FAD-binding subunit|nr:xanthine dehydrogenase family protein subunit M [Alphaproteobacteria bacterium]MBT4086178.1 xanthine dehydrogenase family protein subunit M [Alphaproteobacteria bacterium]MBT4543795.1 xanthine dehydrogenase family protein subunit M [Alphaproteobacteria bacterium]MBT7744040.1 xanthine dehydrogenase family protein subunit M [Alphaproteobacteria bacterium]